MPCTILIVSANLLNLLITAVLSLFGPVSIDRLISAIPIASEDPLVLVIRTILLTSKLRLVQTGPLLVTTRCH